MPSEGGALLTASRRIATVLFADVVNSGGISDVLTLDEYDHFLMDFQRTVLDVTKEKLAGLPAAAYESSIRGDELCIIMYHEPKEDLRRAVEIAGALKVAWLLHARNRARVDEGKEIYDIGIGIHTGDVIVDYHLDDTLTRMTAEGYAINFAKRIEGVSRDGKYTRVMVSQEVYWALKDEGLGITFAPPVYTGLKGIFNKMALYEIKCFLGERYGAGRIAMDDTGLELLARAFLKKPYSLWLGYQLADFLAYEKHNFELCQQVLDRFIEIDDQVPGVWTIYGDIYEEAKEAERALECYKTAVKLDATNPAVWYNLARLYGQLGEPEQEQHCFLKVTRLDPNDAKAFNNLGVTFDRAGQLDRAAENYRRATRLDSNYTLAWYNLGVACSKLGLAEESFSCFRRCTELDPAFTKAWAMLARLHKSRNELEPAFNAIKRAVQLEPDSGALYTTLAELFLYAGDGGNAMGAANKGLSLARRERDQLQARILLVLASALLNQDWHELETAISSSDALNERDTEFAQAMTRLLSVLAARRLDPRAIERVRMWIARSLPVSERSRVAAKA